MSDKNVLFVDLGGGAQATMPTDEVEWKLRYGSLVEVRYVAAATVATLRYLVMECTQKEQIRRLRLMKKAALEEVKRER